MCPADSENRYSEYTFTVTIEQESEGDLPMRGAFAEASGLGVELQPVAFREGGENSAIHKLPGSDRLSSITLKRGVVDERFSQWIMQTQTDHRICFDISIVLHDEKRSDVCQWRLSRAWPTKVNGPSLNTSGDEVAIESLELGFEAIRLAERES